MPQVPIKLSDVTPLPELHNHDRVTIVINMHHEHLGEAPVSLQSIHARLLEHMEEPYQRRLRAGEKWQPVVDSGCWIATGRIGYVTVENLEGRVLTVQPTEEERRKSSNKILEIGYANDSAQADLIYPGSIAIKTPSNASKLVIRCRSGEASYKLHVFSQ